jgi:hypothetical protein
LRWLSPEHCYLEFVRRHFEGDEARRAILDLVLKADALDGQVEARSI